MKTPSIILSRLATTSAVAMLLSVTPPSVRAVTAFSWDTGTAGSPATAAGTWDTSVSNWTTDAGASKTTWTNSNDALFSGAGGYTITVGSGIAANSLQSSTTSTLNFSSGSLDVANISTSGAGSIDMFSKLTGSHGLNYSSTSTASGGRLNVKVANDYTGDTFLSGTAYLLTDTANNALPTGTTLNMDTGTTFRLAKTGGSQQLAGLVSTNTSAGLVTNTVVGYTLNLTTKASTTTTFSGTISSNSTNTLNLVVAGSGTQALNGSNLSFYGTTAVSGGTLSLGGNLTNNTSVTVSGGTLTSSVANVNLGTGGVSMSSGSINPRGTGAAGTFTLAANQNFTTTGGTLSFNIGTALDQIKGSGTGTFGLANSTLDLTLGTGFAYTSTYAILSGFSSGSVSGLTITGYDTTNWVANLANTGVLSFSAAAIPEPSTYAALLGAAVLGFAAIRRRRTGR